MPSVSAQPARPLIVSGNMKTSHLMSHLVLYMKGKQTTSKFPDPIKLPLTSAIPLISLQRQTVLYTELNQKHSAWGMRTQVKPVNTLQQQLSI